MARDDGNAAGTIIVAFVLGAVTGAAVALLMAPTSGEETRRILAEKAREGRERANEAVGKRRMLIGGELPLPGPGIDGVGADRPEIGTPTHQRAVPEQQYAAVAAPDAVEHMDVDRIKSVLHCKAAAP